MFWRFNYMPSRVDSLLDKEVCISVYYFANCYYENAYFAVKQDI